MLADYKMRKDIEKLQNEVNADARASTIHRMVQGSKSSNFAHFSLNTKSTDEYTRGDDDGDDGDGGAGSSSGGAQQQQLTEGVQFAHVSSSQLKPTVKKEDQVGDEGGVDLSDLMAQLSAVQK